MKARQKLLLANQEAIAASAKADIADDIYRHTDWVPPMGTRALCTRHAIRMAANWALHYCGAANEAARENKWTYAIACTKRARTAAAAAMRYVMPRNYDRSRPTTNT